MTKLKSLARKRVLGATRPRDRSQQKERTCLQCGKTFLSEGPWNRRCQSCNHQNAWADKHGNGPIQDFDLEARIRVVPRARGQARSRSIKEGGQL